MSLGERIRELRKRDGLTQEKLAQRIHTTQNSIAKYELGMSEPSVETLRLLASIFDTTVDYLVGMPNTSVPAKAQTSSAFGRLLATTADFSEKETEKLLEYAELLKKGRG